MARFGRAVAAARALRLERPINAVTGSIFEVETTEPVFHLTFDDGPHPDMTRRVLDTLERYEATATFFLVTRTAQTHPEIVQEVVARGHEIGLHSRTHMRLSTASWRDLNDEICAARRDLEEITGRAVHWFRPPYGAGGFRSRPIAGLCGMTSLLWSVDSRDWKGLRPDDPLERTRRGLKPGGILLMHDTPYDEVTGDDAAAGYVPKDELTAMYLDQLAERSLKAVSIYELVEAGKRRRKTKLG